MEVCYYRQWGTICGHSWDTTDAGVACRQLGYSGFGMFHSYVSSVRIETLYTCMLSYTYYVIFVAGATAYRYSYFGRGNGSIYLSNLGCRGSESRLINCYHYGIGIHYCRHYNDAGLRCKCKATILSHASSLYSCIYRRM